jgi:hypothetical protein
MALITCRECKQQVSSEAKACPHCGAKPRKQVGAGTALLVIAVLCVIAYNVSSGVDPTPAAAAPTAASRKADLELNAAIAAGRMLKRSAKDPSSFKMESFLIFPGGAACYEYRAKNSFGALVPAKAVFTPPAILVTSEHDHSRFVRAWDATCTRPDGAERAGGLNLLGVW